MRLSIRMAISKAHGVGVDEAVLAKMLLFERVGNPKAYAELTKAVSESAEGKPAFLRTWEESANAGQDLQVERALGRSVCQGMADCCRRRSRTAICGACST